MTANPVFQPQTFTTVTAENITKILFTQALAHSRTPEVYIFYNDDAGVMLVNYNEWPGYFKLMQKRAEFNTYDIITEIETGNNLAIKFNPGNFISQESGLDDIILLEDGGKILRQ